MNIEIQRIYQPDCTLGVLTCGGLRLFTLELPFINNEQNISCIPSGFYKAVLRQSHKNGLVIELLDVPDRSFIQIHTGNYTSQIKGCILVGDSIKDINGDGVPDVTNSVNSLKKLIAKVRQADCITVEIEW